MTHDCGFLSELSLAADQISFEPAARDEFAADFGTPPDAGRAPDAVVWPETTADVSAVLAAANERGVPVTPYAAGSGMQRNAVPTQGGITLAMTRMDAVRDLRPRDMQVDVEPGVVGDDLNDLVAEEGLFFPAFPQSAAFSTIGGMIATDASGIRTVKYGEVGDWVLQLEVVRPDGSVTEVGSKARKTSAGYNLVDLFVGSEGTLGVVTRATLDLAATPPETVGGRAVFPTLEDATAAITDVVTSGVDVATIELVDPLTAEIANAYTGSELRATPMVFFEVHGRSVDAETDALEAAFRARDATRVEHSSNDEEMAELWRARREIGHALKEWDPDLDLEVIGDVTVPIGSYPAIVEFIGEIRAEYDFPIPAFGHAGDGNTHYAVLCDRDDPEAVERAHEASGRIIDEALALGGTCTGEHGIGVGKRSYLQMEYDSTAIETMRSIKETVDPNGILNPGKIFE
ncbi:FAD-linked oxidase C-terminal domain-containing protein [Halobellus sp. H-GB7]|uniref:FAD-binding oxidoreductase n=1 Tax=Halobellus sp. H-GB7 TaxID=3069756 RepID=UPI0027B5EC8D|nr:FAD-linked oxidase C-terminal domain-containing protein [Halobellus sp. H-GB7]MDQ2055175.1 FAD-linked oxidase C-terminal domain-containing protein [Halobellus sp. H-GB7]